MSVYSVSLMDNRTFLTELEWRHLMGELGGMSTGFPNQRDFCQEGFVQQDPQQNHQVSYSYDNQVIYQNPAAVTETYNQPQAQPMSEWVTYPFEDPNQSQMCALQIIEQPIQKIRFRYQSERGSHGSMSGKKSNHAQKSWPTVQLVNYPMTEAMEVKIRASLFTEDRIKPHVHKLLGKNCNQGTGDCILPLQPDMTCSFPSLGVLFTEKKRVPEVLLSRKLEEYRDKSLGHVNEETRRRLSDEAKQEAKDMKLNSIRICFQAFNKNNEPITEQVFSDPVHNLKSPDSGELKITRLSRCCSSSDGGEEVFLLCEKVNKKDIKVKFFERDEEDHEIWAAYGKFSDSDVHHQVAIVFQTPAYRDPDIEKPVRVLVQLYRQNDHETSDPLPFTYKPKDKDPDHIHNKRRRVNDADNDYTGFGGQTDFTGHHPNLYGPPGPTHWPDGSGNSGGNSMMPPHGGHGYPMNQMANFVNAFAEELRVSSGSSPGSSQDSFYSAQSDAKSDEPSPSAPPAPDEAPFDQPVLDQLLGGTDSRDSSDVSRTPSHELENEYMLPFDELGPIQFEMDCSRAYNQCDLDFHILPTSMKSLRLASAEGEEVTRPSTTTAPRSRRGSKTKVSAMQIGKLVLSHPFTSAQEHGRSDAQNKSSHPRTDTHIKPELKRGTVPSRDLGSKINIENFVRKQMIPRFGRSLRLFTSTGKIQPLLGSLAPFLASQNEEGDNAVHLAVIHQPTNQSLFEQLMPIVNNLMPYDVINHTNNNYQTALHLAVAVQEVQIVTWLLLSGADPNLQDNRGNTPIHLAVLKRNPNCLDALLDKSHYRTYSTEQALPKTSILNFDGNSALHLAVLSGCQPCLTHLMDAEADVNIPDGTSGRTPLHMAVERQSPLIEDLLKQPSVDVDAQDYAGNTPLHLSCSLELPDVVHTLMRAEANPLVENFQWNIEEVDEEEEEDVHVDNNDEEQFHGRTPFDLSKGNDKVLSILRGTLTEDEMKSLQISRRRSREEQAQSLSQIPKPFIDIPNVPPLTLSGKLVTIGACSQHDSGYGDSGVSIQDTCFESKEGESFVQELCHLLDPPNKDWEKLALVVCEEEALLNSMRKLADSPTRILLKKIKERGLILKDTLDAADLLNVCLQIPEFQQRALKF